MKVKSQIGVLMIVDFANLRAKALIDAFDLILKVDERRLLRIERFPSRFTTGGSDIERQKDSAAMSPCPASCASGSFHRLARC